MDKETEAKQWNLCARCGAQRVPDEKAIARCIERGMTEAEAREYTSHHVYNVCPNEADEKHKQAELVRMPFVDGAYYHGHCRNARVARYVAATNRFVYMREKFGYVYPEGIGHAENDNGFDLFKPYGVLEVPPFEIVIPPDLR